MQTLSKLLPLLVGQLGPMAAILSQSAGQPQKPRFIGFLRGPSLPPTGSFAFVLSRLSRLVGPVIAISAVSPLTSMEVPRSRWACWVSRIAGLDLKAADFVPLVKRAEKAAVGASVSGQNGFPKVLVQSMGTNNLPGERGLTILADAIRRHLRVTFRGCH